MSELTLELTLLLVQMVLVLTLFGLELGLVVHIHLELLTSECFLMSLHSLFLLLDQEVDGDFLSSLNRFEVVLVLSAHVLHPLLVIRLKLCDLCPLKVDLLLHPLNLFASLLLEESFCSGFAFTREAKGNKGLVQATEGG